MPTVKYAGLGARFLALLIDFALFCFFFFPATRLIKGTWLMTAADHDWAFGLFIFDPLCLAFLVIIFAYYVLLEGLWGTTAGKRIMGLRVIAVGQEKPGLKRSLTRNLLRLVDGLPACNLLGIVLISFTREKTRLGDLAAGTRVVRLAGKDLGNS